MKPLWPHLDALTEKLQLWNKNELPRWELIACLHGALDEIETSMGGQPQASTSRAHNFLLEARRLANEKRAPAMVIKLNNSTLNFLVVTPGQKFSAQGIVELVAVVQPD